MDAQTHRGGQYLRYEREKRNISIEEIAAQLRLPVATIKNIEEGNYDELPEPVYVRGHVRSYCRLLNIDPAPVLELFSRQPKSDQPQSEGRSAPSLVDEHTQYLIRVWGSILVLAIVGFVLVARWAEKESFSAVFDQVEESAVVEEPDAAIEAEEPPAAAEAPDAAIEAEEPPAAAEAPDAAIEAEEPSVAVEAPDAAIEGEEPSVAVEAPDAAIEGEEPAVEPAIEPPQTAEPPEVDFSDPDDPSQATRTAGTADDANAAVQPPDVVVIIATSGASWARVYGDDNKNIVHRILPPGYRKEFTLRLPLHLELGDARNVRLWLNDVEYDVTRHSSSLNTAFFSIDRLPPAE